MHINTTEFFEPRLRDMTLHGLQCPVLLAYWEEDVKRTAVTLLHAYQDVSVIRMASLHTASTRVLAYAHLGAWIRFAIAERAKLSGSQNGRKARGR